jgi:hypothetical protein
MELTSNRSFPRHTHDEHGIGVILSGAERSWSGMGTVESLPGDVITVIPGEVARWLSACWRHTSLADHIFRH